MRKTAKRARTHRCPRCGHEVPLTTTGFFRSHGVTGELRWHARTTDQAPFCRGSVMRVRDGVVLDADNKPVSAS